ncbi:MAG: glycosyltransferase family 1 protein [Candidatus Margulisiibacteriota bacterium]|nr:MAG: hypothetical protein A2X43_08820 [Candidatus Margulisbacteria bacterium GWD2_39_127]OGI02087.1 MAG: hypothetical protein A2X42_01295 [Candidatus Margulisbacteria bacterium GWF2_38_17]OGI10464.1 MAG: hypothetical protein A2X41_06795 [Candidatus Margulisbacteria bacterium GWE2_39_32]PZM79990.1 MAG: glycosyltransferase family 1 protein [Candidatus Margulisiibacteriota bacterium]HAR63015.1 glycosyltransferase family 1 protein [Candidatus Margulisiibacteriota bacterium]
MNGTIIYICRVFNKTRWGGTETVIINSAKELLKSGYQVKIFTTKALSDQAEESIEGIKIYRFSFSLPWFGLSEESKAALLRKGGNLLSLSMLWALLREKNVVLIHSHVPKRIGAIGRFVAKLKGIPFVVTLHGGLFNVPQEQYQMMQKPYQGKLEWGRIFGWLLGSNKVMKDADAIICVGIDEYRSAQIAYPKKRVVYLPNGVDVNYFKEGSGEAFRNAYNIRQEEKLLLCVSRIDFQKNQLFLINAMAEIIKKNPTAKLVLIGSVSVEDYYEEIKNRITKLHLEANVLVIPGFTSNDHMLRSAYHACNYFVLPTLHEPFGIVILEAWAAGKPVVTSGIGGILGFTEDTGDCLHFDPQVQEDFLDKIQQLIDDQEFANFLARNGYKKVSANFDWSVVCEELLRVYEEVISKQALRRN